MKIFERAVIPPLPIRAEIFAENIRAIAVNTMFKAKDMNVIAYPKPEARVIPAVRVAGPTIRGIPMGRSFSCNILRI